MEESRLPCDVTNGEKEKKKLSDFVVHGCGKYKIYKKMKKGKIVCDDICPVFIAMAAQLDTLSA
jgi:hypothetical protein